MDHSWTADRTATTEDAVAVKGNQAMYQDHYAYTMYHQAALRQEAAQDRLARRARQPPRHATLLPFVLVRTFALEVRRRAPDPQLVTSAFGGER